MARKDRVLKWKYNTSTKLGIPLSDETVRRYEEAIDRVIRSERHSWFTLLIDRRGRKRSS